MSYDGFISYSHAADGRLAPALQSGLQRLAKPWKSRRALRIFRDETGLSTNPHLWSAIEAALNESGWFVLLASPESASSEWVNKEITHWVATKSVERILPVVTDGIWEWDPATADFSVDSSAVPDVLRGALRDEPRHLDLRWARQETDLDLRNSRFRGAVADLAAPIHGIPKDDLEGEDIRQHRRAQRLARGGVSALAVLLVAALIATGFAVIQGNQASSQRNQAQHETNVALAGGLAASAQSLLGESRDDLALLLAVQANRFAAHLSPNDAAAVKARETLLNAATNTASLTGILSGQRGTVARVVTSPDGRLIASQTVAGALRVWDAATRRALPHQPTPTGFFSGGMALSDRGLLVTGQYAGLPTRIWDLRANKPWHWQPPELTAAGSGTMIYSGAPVAISPQGLLAVGAWVWGQSTSEIGLWNINTGQPVGPTLTVPGSVDSLSFSPDGRQLGADVLETNDSAIDLVLIDTSTGAIEHRVVAHVGSIQPDRTTGHPYDKGDQPYFDAVVFSADGKQVSSVTHAADGVVATFDAATGARLGGSPPNRSQNVVGISSDLREEIDQTASLLVVRDTQTGAVRTEYPFTSTGGAGVTPVAVDPVGPEFVSQVTTGPLELHDWTQIAPRPIAEPPSTRRVGATVVGPNGAVDDLAAPLRALGLGDQPEPGVAWEAVASPAGPVAIATNRDLVIWSPSRHRIVRRLADVPAGCANWQDDGALAVVPNLAISGTGGRGHVVLECDNSLRMWNLAAPGSAPAWRRPWTPDSQLSASGNLPLLVVSADGRTVADDAIGGTRVVDGRTGRLRTTGPQPGYNQIVRLALSPDTRSIVTDDFGDTIQVASTANGALLATLQSQHPAELLGLPGAPEIAFSADGRYLGVWRDDLGLEIFDMRNGSSVALLEDGSRGGDTFNSQLQPRQVVVSWGAHDDSVTVTDARRATGTDAQGSTRVLTQTWSLRPSVLEGAACRIVGRDLTRAEWDQYIGSSVPYQRTCN